MHETIRFDITYKNLIEKKDKIRIEFRYHNQNQVPFNLLKSIQFGFIPYKTSIYPTYGKEELITQKLFALIERNEGKDIYDLYYLLDTDIDIDELKKQISNYNQKYKLNISIQAIEKLTKLLEDNNNIRYMQNSTNHYIMKEFRLPFKEYINLLIIKLNDLFKRIK